MDLCTDRMSTGVAGLDEILDGGLIPNRTYLVRGAPGAGKTHLGLHFLTAGAANGEQPLFISLGESEEQIRKDAAATGFDLSGVSILDLSPTSEYFAEQQHYDIFAPAEVERDPITQRIIEQVTALKPKRVFLDPMTQFRYLSPDEFQFRKQVLSFLRFTHEQGATLLFTSESSGTAPDDDLQFMCDGIIDLERSYHRRTIGVTKFRGSDYQPGRHSLQLTAEGMHVFPRLRPVLHQRPFAPETIAFGLTYLDELLHGGLERGTVSIISGPSGVGKTTLGLQFMKEAAGRGERSVVCTFEEARETLLQRAQGIQIPVRAMLERGTLSILEVEPLRITPDEFAYLIRREVEEHDARIVMIDSISGYRLSLVDEGDLVHRLHALSDYLRNVGVTTLLINEIETIAGDFKATETGISYLADNLIVMRYIERHLNGETQLRKSISVLKKRLSDFEKTMREIEITRYGIKVGAPMADLHGLLSGTPVQGLNSSRGEHGE